MFWVMMALLLVIAALMVRRRGSAREAEEPWRASLRDDDRDEPLDIDEIRRAEEEWLAEGDEGWRESVDDEGWR